MGLFIICVLSMLGICVLLTILASLKNKAILHIEDSEEIPDAIVGAYPSVTLDDFSGQKRVVDLLKMHIVAARKTKETVPHILFEGPGGTGKTTLAMCIANEIGSRIFITTPSTFKDKDSVLNFFFEKGTYVCKLHAGDIVFIDEIHRVREAAAIYLYSIMQDNYMDVGGAVIETPPLTFIGATTDSGMLPSPFRDRFKVKVTLTRYDSETITDIVKKYKHIEEEAAKEIAARSCGVPRIAKSITDNVVAYTVANDLDTVSLETIKKVCDMLEINRHGLDKNAIRVIKFFQSNGNSPCGLASLAGTLNISKETIENEVYPILSELGFVVSRGTRGRCLSQIGLDYRG